jgi:hypothetical protein
MDNLIITKFTIATHESIIIMHELCKAIAYEKFSGRVEESVLEQYIAKNFNERELKDEMNSMSNQWLTVYYDGEPAGYARITSKGIQSELFGGKRLIRLADYGILNKFKDTAANQSLFDKCLSTCQSYEGIWLNEYLENPMLDFFERNNFIRKQYSEGSFELPLSSVYLVRDHIHLSV